MNSLVTVSIEGPCNNAFWVENFRPWLNENYDLEEHTGLKNWNSIYINIEDACNNERLYVPLTFYSSIKQFAESRGWEVNEPQKGSAIIKCPQAALTEWTTVAKTSDGVNYWFTPVFNQLDFYRDAGVKPGLHR